tara:strand:+ start:116 stop:385 length:270 start_codon:yes stop_codon:yes gene_type:complete
VYIGLYLANKKAKGVIVASKRTKENVFFTIHVPKFLGDMMDIENTKNSIKISIDYINQDYNRYVNIRKIFHSYTKNGTISILYYRSFDY